MTLLDTEIVIPPKNDPSELIIIYGDPREVTRAKKEITSILGKDKAEKPQAVSESLYVNSIFQKVEKSIEVRKTSIGRVIGKQGSTRMQLESKYGFNDSFYETNI